MDKAFPLSVVSTLYKSGPWLEEFHRRVKEEVARLSPEHEIVLVNDGCPGDSLAKALDLQRRDPYVRIVDLSRNFGHHKAMMTGLAYARGRRVFLIDCDLEEPPELLGDFARKMDEDGADVVYGVQELRKGRLFERWSGALFFRLFNWLSSYPVPENLCTVRLMTHRYVSSLLEHEEREMIIGGLWAITGYKQVAVPIRKGLRPDSSYRLATKLGQVVDAVTSFSDRPLVLIFGFGTAIVCVSTAAALYLIVRRLFFGEFLLGWPSLIVSIWLLGGLTLFCIGIVGMYVAKVFLETKKRPYTIVREVYDRTGELD